jgi:hypothetical protein
MTIISNELPRFTDASDALASRMLILELERSFFGQEDTNLSETLIGELPGILAWALDGWDRLRLRAHFVQPSASAGLVDDLADLASPVAGWLAPVAATNRAMGGLLGVFIALGLTSWLTTCRLVRGQVLSLKTREYVLASRALGARAARVIPVHLLPNTMGTILVAATLGVPNAILLEASLAFLGLGVDPPMPSWG